MTVPPRIRMILLVRLGIVLLVALSGRSEAQSREAASTYYLGQEPPGPVPRIFAPGVVSLPDRSEFGSVFSADGTEFFFGIDTNRRAEIHYSHRQGDSWSKPQPLIFHDRYSHNDPFLSPDEQQLLFISDRPLDGHGEKKDYDIWFVNRTPEGWSEPINVGPAINTSRHEYYISFTQDTVMYFSSNRRADRSHPHNFDIYRSAYAGASFQNPERLPDAINSRDYEADVFVAYDNSYLIFCGNRPDGYGRGDLYISFRQDDGHWTEAKNMGSVINSSGHELCPFVTRDGRYFFYTSRQDIYWVDAQVIREMR